MKEDIWIIRERNGMSVWPCAYRPVNTTIYAAFDLAGDGNDPEHFNLRHGYLPGLAMAQYLWNGKSIEGRGVVQMRSGLSPEALQRGQDTQMEKATHFLRA